jgi:hypothetical protein
MLDVGTRPWESDPVGEAAVPIPTGALLILRIGSKPTVGGESATKWHYVEHN